MAKASNPLQEEEADTIHFTHLEAGRAGPAQVGPKAGTCPGHYPHLPPGGRGGRSQGRSSGWGQPGRRDSGLFGAGAAGRAAGEGGGGRVPVVPRGKFLGRGRCSCAQLFLACQAAPGTELRGRRFQGAGRGQAAGGGKAAGSGGASPRGGAEVRAGSAEAGAWPGRRPLAGGGISWPRQLDHKGGCGRELGGAAAGRTEAGTRRPRGGWGGATAGRAATALRLLKSEQLPVLRAAPGRPAPACVPAELGSLSGV